MSDLVAGARAAHWTASAAEGVYRFMVARAQDAPSDPGRRAWHWHLQFSPSDGGEEVDVTSTIADVVWAPAHHDSVRVLASLASFLAAWDEAIRYGGTESENRRLFPEAAIPVLGAIDEFTVDMYVTEMLGITMPSIRGIVGRDHGV